MPSCYPYFSSWQALAYRIPNTNKSHSTLRSDFSVYMEREMKHFEEATFPSYHFFLNHFWHLWRRSFQLTSAGEILWFSDSRAEWELQMCREDRFSIPYFLKTISSHSVNGIFKMIPKAQRENNVNLVLGNSSLWVLFKSQTHLREVPGVQNSREGTCLALPDYVKEREESVWGMSTETWEQSRVWSCESALETPTENKHSDMSRCYLEACVGGSRVSDAFRVFCHVICSIKICLKEKKNPGS